MVRSVERPPSVLGVRLRERPGSTYNATEMTDELYRSRGKGYMEIARSAKRLLEAAAVEHEDGTAVLTCEAIDAILDHVDDRLHFIDPMAQALMELVLDRDAHIILRRSSDSEGEGNIVS